MISKYASEANWKDPEVTYSFSSNYTETVSKKMTTSKGVGLGVMATICVFVFIGTIVETCPCLDKDKYPAA